MSTFEDADNFLDRITLPIHGVNYTLPIVSGEVGVKFILAKTAGSRVTMNDEEFYRAFLGDALDEMRANGVSPALIQRASMVAVADFERDRATAEVLWMAGTDPKAQKDYLERKANPNSKDSTPSQSSGAARTTKSRASTSGTTSKPKP